MRSLIIVLTGTLMLSCAADHSSAFLDTSDKTTGNTTGEEVTEDVTGDPIDDGPDDWIVESTGFCDIAQNQVYVRKVKDGDTIELKQLVDGSNTVRYIGVDASEIFKVECYSAEAKNALTALIPEGKPLCLKPDSEQENKDMYGRLLRYVYMHDGKRWVQQNARLVRMGDARAYHKFLKGMDFQWEILDAENKAYKENRGGWSDCDW